MKTKQDQDSTLPRFQKAVNGHLKNGNIDKLKALSNQGLSPVRGLGSPSVLDEYHSYSLKRISFYGNS